MDDQQKLVFKFKKKAAIDGSPILPLTEKQLETWLLNLPMMNVMDAGVRLERYLHHLNLIDISDKLRFKLLECIKPTIHVFMKLFYKGMHGRLIDLTDEGKDIHRLVLTINKGMAEAYMFLLQQLANKEPGLLSRKKYVELINKSLFYLGAQLHLSYLIYAPQPKGIWKAMHQIYVYALQRKLHHIKMTDKDIYKYGSVTPEQIYKRLLLQSMISPNSIKSAQLVQVYLGMMPWLDGIKIIADTNVEAHGVGHYIDVMSDIGPVNLQDYKQEDHKFNWKIDNNNLIEQLERWFSEGGYSDPETHVSLSKDLITYLILMLKAHFVAKSKRTASSGILKTIIGLTQTLAELKLEEHEEPVDELALQEVMENTNSDINWAIKDTSGDVWELSHYTIVDETTTEEEEPESEPETPKKSEQQIDIFPWNILDTSPRGYRISCQLDEETVMSIGELLLVKPIDECTDEQQPKWKLATVCWMDVSPQSHEVNMGLHILGQHVQRIHVAKQISEKTKYEDCLLIDDTQLLEPSTLLMSRHYANTGDELLVKAQQKVYKIRIDDVVWYSDGFSQFHFHLLSEPEDSDKIVSNIAVHN
ncbi:hypothetical protein A9Q92_00490 [Methylophaga sp. 42_8_T64]|nr:hypothetical protein A9Q92_00490 [Methylophaga sp. 42_8_T64]